MVEKVKDKRQSRDSRHHLQRSLCNREARGSHCGQNTIVSFSSRINDSHVSLVSQSISWTEELLSRQSIFRLGITVVVAHSSQSSCWRNVYFLVVYLFVCFSSRLQEEWKGDNKVWSSVNKKIIEETRETHLFFLSQLILTLVSCRSIDYFRCLNKMMITRWWTRWCLKERDNN